MPYRVNLSTSIRKAGWTAKIYDAEGPEEPHVTIRCKTKQWRISLRTGDFLDAGGKASEIKDEVMAAVTDQQTIAEMIAYWNARNPYNPV